jgi:hypothetical protein
MARLHVIRAEKKDLRVTSTYRPGQWFSHPDRSHLVASPQPALATDVYALRGSIENIQNGPDAALRFLADCDDPYAIRIRLAMYLEKQDVNGAVKLIDGKKWHLRWCDLGVTAYAAEDRRNDALAIIDWAKEQDDRSKYHQCVVCLADASLVRALAKHEPGKNILPIDLSETEKGAMQRILDDLAPVLSDIISGGFVDSELATGAVKIAWQAHHLLGIVMKLRSLRGSCQLVLRCQSRWREALLVAT